VPHAGLVEPPALLGVDAVVHADGPQGALSLAQRRDQPGRVPLGGVDLEHHVVRPTVGTQLDQLGRSPCLSHHLDVRLPIQDVDQSCPDQPVAVLHYRLESHNSFPLSNPPAGPSQTDLRRNESLPDARHAEWGT